MTRKLLPVLLPLLLLVTAACSSQPIPIYPSPTPIPRFTLPPEQAQAPEVTPQAEEAVTPEAPAQETPTPEEEATTAPTETPTEAPTLAPAETPAEGQEPTAEATSPAEEATPEEAPQPTETPTGEVTVEATEEPTPEATEEATPEAATPEPEEAAEPTQEPAATPEGEPSSGLPPEMAQALASADPARGEQLAVSTGCLACHSLDEGVTIVGPSWYGLGDRAGSRVEGQSAEEYLYRSIVSPDDYVVEGFPPGIMPQIYGDTLNEQEIADLIAYLLTLKAEE